MVSTLDGHPEYAEHFEALPFNSGYFMCVQVKGCPADTVRRILLERYDTGLIALGPLLRIAYSSLPKTQIPELFSRIHRACQDANA